MDKAKCDTERSLALRRVRMSRPQNDRIWFYILMLYIVLEYGRPQDKIEVIGRFRPGVFITLLLAFSLVASGRFTDTKCRRTTLIYCFILILIIWIPCAANNFFAFITAYGMLLLLPCYLAFLLYVNSFERLLLYVRMYVLIMLYICINILLYGSGEGMGGNFLEDENDYSLLINMMIPFAVFMMRWEQRLIGKLFYAICSLCAIASIGVSFSRGGFVGLACVGVCIFMLSPRKIITLTILIACALTIWLVTDQGYWNEMRSIKDTQGSTSRERIESWKSGINMFLHRPWGVGGGNFPVMFSEYQTDFFDRGMWGRAAHSVWIQLLTELGVFGVMIYGMLMWSNIKGLLPSFKLKRSDDPDFRFAYYISMACFCSMVAFYSSGTFLSVLYYPHYWYLTALMVCMSRAVAGRLSQEAK